MGKGWADLLGKPIGIAERFTGKIFNNVYSFDDLTTVRISSSKDVVLPAHLRSGSKVVFNSLNTKAFWVADIISTEWIVGVGRVAYAKIYGLWYGIDVGKNYYTTCNAENIADTFLSNTSIRRFNTVYWLKDGSEAHNMLSKAVTPPVQRESNKQIMSADTGVSSLLKQEEQVNKGVIPTLPTASAVDVLEQVRIGIKTELGEDFHVVSVEPVPERKLPADTHELEVRNFRKIFDIFIWDKFKQYRVSDGQFFRQRKVDGVPSLVVEIAKTVRSLGVKVKNYKIKLPDGSYTNLTEGTRLTNVHTIAGKGRDRKIDEIDGLLAIGGSETEWMKKKGIGYVDYDGESYKAEIHWYEEPTVGKEKFKVKSTNGRWFLDD